MATKKLSDLEDKAEKTKKSVLNNVRQLALMCAFNMGLFVLTGICIATGEYLWSVLYAVFILIILKDIGGYYRSIKTDLEMLDMYSYSNGCNDFWNEYCNKPIKEEEQE